MTKSEYQSARRAHRIANKLCLDCGRPAEFLSQRCEECRVRQRRGRDAKVAIRRVVSKYSLPGGKVAPVSERVDCSQLK